MEALEILEMNTSNNFEIIIMVQGDEPLITPIAIDNIISNFKDPNIEIINLMTKIETYNDFININNIKVVYDNNFNALYFSREPIPSHWNSEKKLMRTCKLE